MGSTHLRCVIQPCVKYECKQQHNSGLLNSWGLYAKFQEIVIYPNPAKDFINIKTELTERSPYSLHSISGEKVLSGFVDPQHKTIELPANVSSGLCLLDSKQTSSIARNYQRIVSGFV